MAMLDWDWPVGTMADKAAQQLHMVSHTQKRFLVKEKMKRKKH